MTITEVMRRNLLQPGPFVQELRRNRNAFDGTLSYVEAACMLRLDRHDLPEQTRVVLANLFASLRTDLTGRRGRLYDHSSRGLSNAFRQSVLPYLSNAEHRAIQDELRPTLGTVGLPPNHFVGGPPEVYLAAALGLHEEIGRIVRSIPDDHYVWKRPR